MLWEGERKGAFTSNASKIARHCDSKTSSAIGIRLGGSQIQLSRPQRVTRLIHITRIWPCSIRIKLVYRHRNLRAFGHGCDGLVGELGFGICSDINVACKQRASAFVNDIGGDFGRVDDVSV